MPIYVFECKTCGEKVEKYLPCDKRNDGNEQPHCSNVYCHDGFPMKRIIVRANIELDLKPYFDENLTNDATESAGGACPSYDDRDHKLDGVYVTSKRQKRELMKRWGYVHQV